MLWVRVQGLEAGRLVLAVMMVGSVGGDDDDNDDDAADGGDDNEDDADDGDYGDGLLVSHEDDGNIQVMKMMAVS